MSTPLQPAPGEWPALYARVAASVAHLRLPFRSRLWRGATGNWAGAGIGSSIDYQDHRPYLPGDDPRYIDWLAYARTGNYIMKLYREEVSPRVDLVLDVSPSMAERPDRRLRALELFAFVHAASVRAGATVRGWLAGPAEVRPIPEEALHPGAWPAPASAPGAARMPPVGQIAWRPGSLRVFISDLLYPGAPDGVVALLAAARASGLILAPYDAAEADPDWDGNLEMIDAESDASRLQRVDAPLRARYRAAYARHFDLWRDRCRRFGVTLARVPAEPPLRDALRAEAVPAGAVEAA